MILKIGIRLRSQNFSCERNLIHDAFSENKGNAKK